jgi:hypothetical protein
MFLQGVNVICLQLYVHLTDVAKLFRSTKLHYVGPRYAIL